MHNGEFRGGKVDPHLHGDLLPVHLGQVNEEEGGLQKDTDQQAQPQTWETTFHSHDKVR